MTYLLSNIAKSCVLTENRRNILYLPDMSVVDSIITSLSNFNILTPDNYWINNIDAMIYSYSNTSINDTDILLKYHFKIIKIITDTATTVQNNIYNLNLDINKFSIRPPGIDDTKLLLYILDTNPSQSTMVLEYLNSLQINFTVFKPAEFININIIKLIEILSQFKFVLNNSNIDNLILAKKICPTPITFVKEFASKDTDIKLVNENNFKDIISDSENCEAQSSNIDNTRQKLVELNENIMNFIYETPFIL